MTHDLPSAAKSVDAAGTAAMPMDMVRFLDRIWSTKTRGDLFDPWRQRNHDDLDEGAVSRRRFALAAHLSAPSPSLLCVGEAPGYRGCRVSGVPFTSEGQISDGVIPRLTSIKVRFSDRNLPWREVSATHVWNALEALGLERNTLLWNAVPWHPHPAGKPEGNRRPSHDETQAGLDLLRLLVKAMPKTTRILAIGRVSEKALQQIDISANHVVHPAARNGARLFREGVEGFVSKL